MPYLSNYLRANRKRLGLSQKELAALLGVESGTKASRYERFARQPNLETALAYEAVFDRPIRDLFAGLSDRIEREVAARARKLLRKMDGQTKTHGAGRKRQVLEQITRKKSLKNSH